MTNIEIRAFLTHAEELRRQLAGFQQMQANLLRAHPQSETQLAYDVNAIQTACLYYDLSDIIREAKRELEAQEMENRLRS